MPRYITLNDLEQAKLKHNFEWEWEPGKFPNKKTSKEKNSRTHLYLICGKCKTYKWVEWSALRRGHSMRCWNCTHFPTAEKMAAVAAKFKTLWKPTLQYRSDPKTHRRSFHMRCACGKWQWIRWNHFSQGQAIGCRSCMSARRIDGRSKDPLWRIWRGIKNGSWTSHPRIDWGSFQEFKEWAKPLYSPGLKITRYNKDLPFGPENCDFIAKKAAKPLRLQTDGQFALPTGVGVRRRNPTKSQLYPVYHGLKGRNTLGPEWSAFPIFEQWAKTSGWIKGAILKRKDRKLAHGPSNSYWKIPTTGAELNGVFLPFWQIAEQSKHDLTESIVRRRITKFGLSAEEAIASPREKSKPIVYYGETYTLEELAKKSPHKLAVTTLRYRLSTGMCIRDALKTPPKRRIKIERISA